MPCVYVTSMVMHSEPMGTHHGGLIPVLAQSQMVRDVGEFLRLPLLHVENDKWWGSVAENPLREHP